MSADDTVDDAKSQSTHTTAEAVSEPSVDQEGSEDKNSQSEDLIPAGGRQTGFGDSGELEYVDESFDTSLDQFGADIEPVKESKQEQEQATSILKDDRDNQSKMRESAEDTDDSEQGQLFPDVNDGQQTLTGEEAHDRFLFEQDD